jgi:hypothetical protein
MDYRKKFVVEPGERVRLHKIDAGYKGKHVSKKDALPKIEKHCDQLAKLQHVLYSEKKHSCSSCCRRSMPLGKMEPSIM